MLPPQECLCELYSRFIEDSKVMNETKALTGVENIIATLLATEVCRLVRDRLTHVDRLDMQRVKK